MLDGVLNIIDFIISPINIINGGIDLIIKVCGDINITIFTGLVMLLISALVVRIVLKII